MSDAWHTTRLRFEGYAGLRRIWHHTLAARTVLQAFGTVINRVLAAPIAAAWVVVVRLFFG